MEWFEMIVNNNAEATARNKAFIEFLKGVDAEIEKLGFEAFFEVQAPVENVYLTRNEASVFIPELNEKPYKVAHLHMDLFTPARLAKTIVWSLKWKK